MAGEFSGAELIPALVLLAPGFLVILVVARLTGRRAWGGVFEKSLLSLMLSGLIGAVFLAVNRIPDPDSFFAFIFRHPLVTLAEVVTFSVVFSMALAAILIYDPFSRGFRRIAYGSRGAVPEDRLLWDRFMQRNQMKPALIECQDGTVFQGFLSGYSQDEEKSSVQLSNVFRVGYDDSGAPTKTDEGIEILLMGDDIKRVTIQSGEPGKVIEP